MGRRAGERLEAASRRAARASRARPRTRAARGRARRPLREPRRAPRLAPPAERVAEELVPDARARERRREPRARVLREAARHRKAAHVGDAVDPRLAEQREELRRGAVRVTGAEDLRSREAVGRERRERQARRLAQTQLRDELGRSSAPARSRSCRDPWRSPGSRARAGGRGSAGRRAQRPEPAPCLEPRRADAGQEALDRAQDRADAARVHREVEPRRARACRRSAAARRAESRRPSLRRAGPGRRRSPPGGARSRCSPSPPAPAGAGRGARRGGRPRARGEHHLSPAKSPRVATMRRDAPARALEREHLLARLDARAARAARARAHAPGARGRGGRRRGRARLRAAPPRRRHERVQLAGESAGPRRRARGLSTSSCLAFATPASVSQATTSPRGAKPKSAPGSPRASRTARGSRR